MARKHLVLELVTDDPRSDRPYFAVVDGHELVGAEPPGGVIERLARIASAVLQLMLGLLWLSIGLLILIYLVRSC